MAAPPLGLLVYALAAAFFAAVHVCDAAAAAALVRAPSLRQIHRVGAAEISCSVFLYLYNLTYNPYKYGMVQSTTAQDKNKYLIIVI